VSHHRGADALIQSLVVALREPLPDPEHARRSALFADTLFSGTAETLGLSQEHRPLAIAAGLLHDIGYLRSPRDHHRKSFDIIRGLNLPEFSDREQLIVACAARYHGHTLPNIEHAGFGEMDFEDQRVVRRIAAITRVATTLDASHLGLISEIDVHASEGEITLVAIAQQEPAVERDRLRESAGSFVSLTQVPLRIEIQIRPEGSSRSSVEES
jgi:exopolyphosphatase / guanosine-5'-triphosphate,3'-diphosphate pyrophosphatase